MATTLEAVTQLRQEMNAAMNQAQKLAYAPTPNYNTMPDPPRERTIHTERWEESVANWKDTVTHLRAMCDATAAELQRASHEAEDLERYRDRLAQHRSALLDCVQRLESIEGAKTLVGMGSA